MKKITIEISEPNKIIGSPTYGQSEVTFKPEGLTNGEIVLLLGQVLGSRQMELIKEMEEMKQRIINLQTPLNPVR